MATLKTCRPPTLLSPLGLSPVYASRWPELQKAQLLLGDGDGACANLGSGCRDPTRLAVTVGTSAAARIVLPGRPQDLAEIKVPYGLWCYRIDKSRLLLGGALTDGGSLVQWMTETLSLRRYVKEEVKEVSGLTFIRR